ncbi:unnamed protein product [Meloidogyne enterolobii]|uniref:Uncharacterized protein n=1 Tax=Meloidogyne enterolobii TaxID=390850 RepID=A0ACB1B0F9_MELEN
MDSLTINLTEKLKSQPPVNDQNSGEVPNLSNNNGQPSSSNPNDNGGDNPKNNEYESQIKDLQETVTRQNIEYSRLLNELKQRISLQEQKVLEKEEIIKQNQEKIEKREELIAKLLREKISAEEQKKNLEELNKKLEEGKNKSEKGETIFNTVVEVGVGALEALLVRLLKWWLVLLRVRLRQLKVSLDGFVVELNKNYLMSLTF